MVLVRVGGLGFIFQELLCHDEHIKKATSALVLLFTRGGLAKEHLADYEAIKTCLSSSERMYKHNKTSSHSSNGHVGVERCVIEYLANLCEVKSLKRELVTMGVMNFLLKVLALEDLPSEYSHLIVKAIHELAQTQENQVSIKA